MGRRRATEGGGGEQVPCTTPRRGGAAGSSAPARPHRFQKQRQAAPGKRVAHFSNRACTRRGPCALELPWPWPPAARCNCRPLLPRRLLLNPARGLCAGRLCDGAWVPPCRAFKPETCALWAIELLQLVMVIWALLTGRVCIIGAMRRPWRSSEPSSRTCTVVQALANQDAKILPPVVGTVPEAKGNCRRHAGWCAGLPDERGGRGQGGP